MLLERITANPWLSVGIWAVMYCLDYGLTIWGAKLYQSSASQHYSFSEGYELNPVFKDDVAKLRPISFRFVLLLIFTAGLLLILFSIDLPGVYTFGWGALIGLQLSILARHIRNLALFYHARGSGGIVGRIEIKSWLSQRIGAFEFLYFSGLFLFFYLLVGSLFMLGAACGCFSMALSSFLHSRRKAAEQTKSD